MLLCLAVIGMSGALAVNGCRDTLDPWDRGVLGGPPQAVLVSDTLFPDADTYVRKTQPNTNWGSATALSLGGGGWNRVLLRFDSTAIRTAVGAGTLDSAWLELTIQVAASGWGQNERTVDLHRLLKSWTELGATWNCAVDANTGNSVPNCPAQAWDMTVTGSGTTFAATRTDRVIINNGQTGIVRLNVTGDIAALLDGSQMHHGWVFRKTGDALGGEGVVFSKESGSQPRLVLSVTSHASVPMAPPDSTPNWFRDDSSYANHSGGFLRGVVVLRFQPSASQAQRQAAVDAVAGVIVGGTPVYGGEGFYYVRIADDGSGAQLNQAIQALRGLPQTNSASLTFRFGPNYLRPADGPAWGRNDWALSPDSASGINWALEQIAAPLAWGCSAGDASARIVIYDHGYDSTETNLNVRLPYTTGLRWGANDTIRHGTRVASLVAAKGNNGSGMSGVMWNAQLDLMDHSGVWSPAAVATAIAFAGRHGADAINISAGINWQTVPSGAADSLSAGDYMDPMWNVLQELYDEGAMPLIVVAAGNNGVQAHFSGLPRLQLRFPSHVLVVGGNTRGRAREVHSNAGPLVEIFAPGESVTVLTAGDVPLSVYGTSYAAPLVTGVAGLLASFDSTLTPAQIHDLILAGAVRGGRTVSGLPYSPAPPILNAYESLKAAAERAGAPICGNRVFFRGDTLFAQRGNSGVEEKIVSGIPGNGMASLDVRHSGHLIAAGGWMWRWNAGTWDTTSSYPVDLAHSTNGSTWGSGGVASMKHDLDSLIVITYGATVPGPFDVRMGLVSDNSQNRLITSFSGVPGGTGVSPMGNELVVPVWRGDTGFTWDIYRVNSTSGAQSFLFARPGVDGVHATYSEDGREFSVAAYNQNGQCEIEFFNAATAVSVRPKVSYPAGLGFCRGIGMWGAARRATSFQRTR